MFGGNGYAAKKRYSHSYYGNRVDRKCDTEDLECKKDSDSIYKIRLMIGAIPFLLCIALCAVFLMLESNKVEREKVPG